jgi:drug/metabolite transporter superfamily protein YnfA
MKQFFLNMFSNKEGTSHKRVLGTIGFISLVVFLFLSSDQHKEAAVNAVEYITIATVFGTVVEKFVPKNTKIEE